MNSLPQIIKDLRSGQVEPWVLLKELLDEPQERDRVLIRLIVAAIAGDRQYIIESNLGNPEWIRQELNRVWETLRDLEGTLSSLISEGE